MIFLQIFCFLNSNFICNCLGSLFLIFHLKLKKSFASNLISDPHFLEKFLNDYCHPAGNFMFKVNNGNTITRCEICSKLTIKTPERRY